MLIYYKCVTDFLMWPSVGTLKGNFPQIVCFFLRIPNKSQIFLHHLCSMCQKNTMSVNVSCYKENWCCFPQWHVSYSLLKCPRRICSRLKVNPMLPLQLCVTKTNISLLCLVIRQMQLLFSLIFSKMWCNVRAVTITSILRSQQLKRLHRSSAFCW